jgi:hypothetical protein
MSDSELPKQSRRPGKRSEPRTLAKFVEELSWLLSSYEDLDFRALGNLGADLIRPQRAATNIQTHSINRKPTTHLLVGTLPSLLTDESLFPSNEDIVEFSTMTLGITIPRWQKKSKYELIGHIVCHTDLADQEKIFSLVQVLNSLLSDKGETKRNLAEQRQSGLSWNEVIQRLLKNS